MKNSIGTSMGGAVHRRPRQLGNVRCKDCIYLKYRATAKFNYYCNITHQPKEYTKKCYCKYYRQLKSNDIKKSTDIKPKRVLIPPKKKGE